MEKMYTKKVKGYEVETPVSYKYCVSGTVLSMFINQTLSSNPYSVFVINVGLS